MKRLKYLLIVGLFAFVASCGSSEEEKPKRPDHIIPEEMMVDIMVDLYIVESANNMRILDRDTNNPSYGDFVVAVMEKYNFTKDDYERSLKYYAQDPEDINAIYDETLERLSKMESEAGVVRTEEDEM